MRALTILTSVAAAVALPNVPRQQYNLYNDGTRGSVSNMADDFGADYHTSAFMSRLGCSTTAKIKECYAADLSADPTKMLETADYKPWINGGVGTNQRALLLGPHMYNTTGVITHKVRFHLSTAFTSIPAGREWEVTLVGLRNFNASFGMQALDVRASHFVGEETSGTWIWVAATEQNGQSEFPLSFALSDAIGKTMEVTYRLGVNGATVHDDIVADVSVKFVDTGKELTSHSVPKSLHPKGIVSTDRHRLIFGADRKVKAGMKQLKVWFGDYTINPQPPFQPD
ncbi:hypothetical protein AURDEDRAFT_132809 [Auricularia subglabra TFB-10046 SS5]|nr:hypothetical protein AURDEDRAFT_132809 [Auricularia subglabra TFB-10046 SS5]